MRREPGWWWGLAEFSPAATMVSKAVLSAPPRRMAVSSSRAKCSSVTPWPISGSTSKRAASAMAAARSMRAISAASFRSRSASTALRGGDQPRRRRAGRPRCAGALQLTLSASRPMRAMRRCRQRGLRGLALLGRRADGDVDLRGRAGLLDLLGRLRAVAPVGRQQRGVPGHGEHARRAGEARQVAHVGQGRHHQGVDPVLVEAVAQAVQAPRHRDGRQRHRGRRGVRVGAGVSCVLSCD